MNVYVETNFVLELAFMQEQYESCEEILALCEAGSAQLILPAFSIAESYERLIRRADTRKQIRDDLAKELQELSRSKPYGDETQTLQSITGLLLRSTEDEDRRLNSIISRLLGVAVMIPLDADIVADVVRYRADYGLGPQDSLVFSSISHHLLSSGDVESCLIEKDKGNSITLISKRI